ncbi:hypothetical protein [Paenirhodobacter sp.]|uniref:hypothetical protein n=1 Tax=Paenirhodobacter sp. TaxID=1965326 RepID=UPI003B40843E
MAKDDTVPVIRRLAAGMTSATARGCIKKTGIGLIIASPVACVGLCPEPFEEPNAKGIERNGVPVELGV